MVRRGETHPTKGNWDSRIDRVSGAEVKRARQPDAWRALPSTIPGNLLDFDVVSRVDIHGAERYQRGGSIPAGIQNNRLA
jgi:hypothetical protein